MVMLNDKTVKILNDYLDGYLDAPRDERMSCADRLVGALDMALATSELSVGVLTTAEVKDGD